MTCIVAIERNNTVYMAGDSAAAAGDDINIRKDEKVFVNGPMIMGFTSSFRMGQLLRYGLKVPKQKPKQDVMQYLVVDFVSAVRACLKHHGSLTKEEELEHGPQFLLGYKKKLYLVDSDFQVGRCAEPYYSVGSGSSYALGVLHDLTRIAGDPKLTPETILTRALEAASYHSASVAPPFTMLKLKR